MRARCRVYPRVYGATASLAGEYKGEEGLSPCVRGYRPKKSALDTTLGSIPVCTGLPRSDSLTCSASRGLSPCVRGYPHPAQCGAYRQWSIPVCTGLPTTTSAIRHSGWVYPRVYGATHLPRREPSRSRGLSPCVRGYQRLTAICATSMGSIPVCTGLPTGEQTNSDQQKVYPRVYGATMYPPSRSHSARGLSPCVRGYLQRRVDWLTEQGSIPVCTGLPPAAGRASCHPGVYPRVYGATTGEAAHWTFAKGLSPCVRGYRVLPGPPSRGKGSIPVCTGLPTRFTGESSSSRVYPRVYGATSSSSGPPVSCSGLSPCVRGYPCYKVSPFRHGRSIFFPSTLFLRHFVAGKVGLRRATCSPTAT